MVKIAALLIYFFPTVAWSPQIVQPTYEYGYNVDRWQGIVSEALEAYGIPEQRETFMRVMNCESRGLPDAHNTYVYDSPGQQASGLMQHLPVYWKDRAAQAGLAGYSPFNPVANIFTSAWLLTTRGGGWSHWTCY